MAKALSPLFLVIFIGLGGCGTIEGADPVLGTSGTYNGQPTANDQSSPNNDPLVQLFLVAHRKSAGNPDDVELARGLVRSSFGVIRKNCDLFFQTEGTTQRWIFVSRDAVGALGTITTGIMGALGAGSTSVAWVGLTSGTAYSGLDIYSKHFLFNSDNVDAVHDLVRTQLLHDQDAATTAMKANPSFGFYEAVPLIFQMQDVCTPAHILSLVRKAIKEGKADEDTSLQRAAQAAFEQFYASTFLKETEEIGELINGGAQRASNDQITALLWLYNGHNPDDQEKEAIANMLGTDAATRVGVKTGGTLTDAKKASLKAAIFRVATLPAGKTLDDKVGELHDKVVAARTPDPAPPPQSSAPTPPSGDNTH